MQRPPYPFYERLKPLLRRLSVLNPKTYLPYITAVRHLCDDLDFLIFVMTKRVPVIYLFYELMGPECIAETFYYLCQWQGCCISRNTTFSSVVRFSHYDISIPA